MILFACPDHLLGAVLVLVAVVCLAVLYVLGVQHNRRWPQDARPRGEYIPTPSIGVNDLSGAPDDLRPYVGGPPVAAGHQPVRPPPGEPPQVKPPPPGHVSPIGRRRDLPERPDW